MLGFVFDIVLAFLFSRKLDWPHCVRVFVCSSGSQAEQVSYLSQWNNGRHR